MQRQRKSFKNVLLPFIFVFLIISIAIVILCTNSSIAYAENDNNSDSETVTLEDEKGIDVTSYLLDDNSGYNESQDKVGHILGKNLINLSVCAQSEISQPEVQEGAVQGYEAYGISGQSVSIRLSYNYSDPENLLGTSNDKFSISSDTYQSVGDFKIGVIGKGALLFQKKTDPNGPWEWQTKDGETKNQLHTSNFTETVELGDYCNTGEKYILYTPSGNDLSKGVYIKITFAYELKKTTVTPEKNFWGIWKDVTHTTYYNIIETAEFYMVQNSGVVLFHNASNFGQVGEESSSGAISIEDFDTILDGDVTINGFRMDTLGVSAYDITYKHNGETTAHNVSDGQFFLEHGRYDFTIKTKLGKTINHTIFVDRREINDAIVGYFGQTIFTPNSKRIYTTGQYPTYLAGAELHLNATNGTVSPLVGKLCRLNEEDEKPIDDSEKDIIPQRVGNGYAARELTQKIEEPGLYKAEFWNNAKCLDDNAELSGDVYHFVFKFQIVDADTAVEPSINEAYLNGLIGFSDLNSKYYAVTVPTKGSGNAVFAFADYGGAYDFAYELEREIVKNTNSGYEYNGKTYTTQYDVLGAIDLTAKSRIAVKYFDATDPESYQTADISGTKLSDLNYDSDIIVFNNDLEQEYLKVGLPFLNGRKYRYIMPVDVESNGASPISEGVLSFAFIKVDDFETQSITLSLVDDPSVSYNIAYGVSVEYQLGLLNAPSGKYKVTEHNANSGDSEYEAVYIRPGDMTAVANVSLYCDGEFTERIFDKNHLDTVRNISGFIINSVANELDPYGIVKITHNGATEIFAMSEADGRLFSDGGAYDIDIVDRLGNEMRFAIVVTSPVGCANIHLQLDENEDDIQTEFNVFVGQEIDLPNINAANELYVFDGWLCDDVLIKDGKYTPTKAGDIYIWAQFTQKYTYLNFDSNGGTSVERIKAEIGKECDLPLSTRNGWKFGGWQYGGNVYGSTYTPTTASPTFVAVWNYIKTDIELYDGNLVDTVTANVGDKVILPFPTRTGYTFFGWRLDLGNGQNKIFYGQITKLENIEYMRLDALWIHNSEVEQSLLAQGTGGRTAIYFIDGTLFENDTITASVGTNISMPVPSRAGFTFVGWVWRTTPISGKIYTGDTLTVPQNTDGKIVLEALWIARSVNNGAYVASSVTEHNVGGGFFDSIAEFIHHEPIAFASIILSIIVVAIIAVRLAKKKGSIAFTKRTSVSACANIGVAPVLKKDGLVTRQEEYKTQLNRCQKLKAFISGFKLNPLSVTVCTALLMTVVMALTGVIGSWERSTVAVAETVQVVSFDQNQAVESGEIDQDFGGSFNVNTNLLVSKEENDGFLNDSELTIEKANSICEESSHIEQADINMTNEEVFLCSVVMLSLQELGYYTFPAIAVLPNGREIFGIGYTNYLDVYELDRKDFLYFSAGFVEFLNQQHITEDDLNNDIKIYEMDRSKRDENKYAYLLKMTESHSHQHYIKDGKYVTYTINQTVIDYTSVPNDVGAYNLEYGAIFSYDDDRYVFDPDIGKSVDTITTSLNTLLDPIIAENEYNRYIAEQTANGFTVDTMNFVYIRYEALEAYCLTHQDESLLGIDVQEFYDIERTVGPNEYYTVDADGNLTKLEFPPNEDESKASWLDRLFGAIISVGIIVAGVIIVATLNIATGGAASAATPYIMGAFIGAGMEVFMQTVIQGKPIKDINWLRVGVAAVSGVLSAIPGVGWFGAGLIQGVTEAAMTAVDGGSLEDVFKAFTVGFVTGVVIHGVGKALSAGVNKIKKTIRCRKGCFVAGTSILLYDNTIKPIENIEIGDMVKCYNEDDRKVENQSVTEVFKYDADEIIHIILSNGENISTTPSHLFRTASGWVEARDLQSQDILFNIDQRFVEIDNVYSQVLDSPISVYNFTVANNHNYYVATDNINAVLVHNDCNISKFQIKDIDDFTKGYNSGNVTSGIGKTPPSGTANTVYVKVDNSGNIMNITYYDNHGLPSRRLDIVGKPHPCKDLGNQSVIPHIHDYKVNLNPKNGQWGLGKEETNSASKELVNAIINYFKGL